MNTIDCGGYFVCSEDEAWAEKMAEHVRLNEPFLGASVRHNNGPERAVAMVNRKTGEVGLCATRESTPGVYETVSWAECSFRLTPA